ncbi:MAG: bifunctional indole-3-glycerol-phosphate synthase TrpC/phosphoribosylanthranilate isomerase TrpF [archaeon]
MTEQIPILDRIISRKREDLVSIKRERPLESFRQSIRPSTRSFSAALARPRPAIICEIKKASPSKGVIRQDLDAAKVAAIYDLYADAVSVVTDGPFFSGSLDMLRQARTVTALPILRKDFIIDPYQVYEARDAGADAVLLIASVLSSKEITELSALAASLGMDSLVEVHDTQDLDRAIEADSKIVGINNRDLRTFEVDLEHTSRMAKLVPSGIIIVSESGMNSRSDICSLSDAAGAFLIGTTIMAADDIGQRLSSLSSPRVKICGIADLTAGLCAAKAGADMMGFVFEAKSPRNISPERAIGIIDGVNKAVPSCRTVGVFVDAEISTVVGTAKVVGLDMVQLHGDEDEAYIADIKDRLGLPVIKGLRIRDQGDLDRIASCTADIILLDAFSSESFGGTGKRVPLGILQEAIHDHPGKRIMIAGGISADNVHEVLTLSPYGVDVSSSLEISPGIKDGNLIYEFMETFLDSTKKADLKVMPNKSTHRITV